MKFRIQWCFGTTKKVEIFSWWLADCERESKLFTVVLTLWRHQFLLKYPICPIKIYTVPKSFTLPNFCFCNDSVMILVERIELFSIFLKFVINYLSPRRTSITWTHHFAIPLLFRFVRTAPQVYSYSKQRKITIEAWSWVSAGLRRFVRILGPSLPRLHHSTPQSKVPRREAGRAQGPQTQSYHTKIFPRSKFKTNIITLISYEIIIARKNEKYDWIFHKI